MTQLPNSAPEPIGTGSSASPLKIFRRRWLKFWTPGGMLLYFAAGPLLVFVGCTTQRDLPPYVYTPPVVVSLANTYHTNDWSVLIFAFTNVSSYSMSYAGYDREHPIFYYQFKNREPSSNDQDEIVPTFQLAPGQSGTFHLKLENHSIPFRAGIMMSEEFKSYTGDIYWSPYITP